MTGPIPARAPDRRLKRVVAAITVGALALLVVLRAVDLWWWRRQLLDAGQQRAEHQTRILAEYVRGAFATGDAALRQLAIEARRIGGSHAPDEAWAPLLNAVKASLISVNTITITDAESTITHSTQTAIIGLSRRDEYLYKQSIQGESGRLLVGPPLLSQSEPRRYLVPIGQRLTQKDDVYDGVAVVTFIPDELRDFFGTLDLGRQGTLWVFHPSGVVLFNEPSNVNLAGQSAVGNPIFEAARSGEADALFANTGPRGAAQISAYRSTPTPPLILAISLNETKILTA